MNNKGFTLIELLATIVLLGIISAISYVSINAVIEKNKENNCETLKNNIISAAKMYVSDNRYSLKTDDKNILILSVATLIDEGYLTGYTENTNIEITIELKSDKTVKSVNVPEEVCE